MGTTANKIGLYGGTFDPVHNGHINIALTSFKQLGLDEVWFLIEEKPRNKIVATSYYHREKMLELALKMYPNLVASNAITKNLGKTHDINSLFVLLENSPKVDFTLIAGIDTLQNLDKWQDYSKFISLIDFAIAPRPRFPASAINNLISRLGENAQNFKFTILDMPFSDASSSEARNSIKVQKTTNFLDENVLNYISAHKLYR